VQAVAHLVHRALSADAHQVHAVAALDAGAAGADAVHAGPARTTQVEAFVHLPVADVVGAVAGHLGRGRDGAQAGATDAAGAAAGEPRLARADAGPLARGRAAARGRIAGQGAAGGVRGKTGDAEAVHDAVAVVVETVAQLGDRLRAALADGLLA